MRESKIESTVCNYAKTKGWRVFKFSSPGQRAVPDRIFLRKQVCFYIEFKAPGKKPTKLQEKIISDIRGEGFDVYVCDDIQQGKNFIESYEKLSNDNKKGPV